MMGWLLAQRAVFEVLYFISGIILAGTVIAAIVQVRLLISQMELLKQDIKTRNQRAAAEKSIEHMNWYAKEFIPTSELFVNALQREGVAKYSGKINPEFLFDENCKFDTKTKESLRIKLENNLGDVMNPLESFSASFIHGVAEEKVAFSPIARDFCDTVEWVYDVICYLRKDGKIEKYANIIKLYNIWNNRIEKYDKINKRNELDRDIQSIPEEEIRAIGL